MKYDPLDIANKGGHNAGGLCSLVFVPKQWIDDDAVVSRAGNIISTAPTLIVGASWLSAKFMQDTLGFSEVQDVTGEGNKFTQVITGVLNKDSADNNSLLNALVFSEYVVIYTSRNGNRKYIGNKSKGMQVRANFNTGAEFSGKEAYTITFSFESEERAPQYTL